MSNHKEEPLDTDTYSVNASNGAPVTYSRGSILCQLVDHRSDFVSKATVKGHTEAARATVPHITDDKASSAPVYFAGVAQ